MCQNIHKFLTSTWLNLTVFPALLTFFTAVEPTSHVLLKFHPLKDLLSTNMRFFTIASTFLAVASASALPNRHWNKCLSQDQANSIVGQFIEGLQHPDVPAANATLQALLADNFQEVSDSILSLEGQPVRTLALSRYSAHLPITARWVFFRWQARIHQRCPECSPS